MQYKYDVSVIIPFYKGNKYIDNISEMIEKNAINSKLKIELVLVNDSPQIKIKKIDNKSYDVHIVCNKENRGIHYSRVQGIKNAAGKYILMLDQDDILFDNAIKSQHDKIKDYDMIVSNGEDENPINKGTIYHSKKHQDCLLNEKYYYYVGNMIVSPGQCLIKKEAISHLWLDHSIKNNGCDDFMLWIIMFFENKKITVNYDLTYVHTYNGENVSADFAKMKMSSIEMMTYLSKHGIITKENEMIYMDRLKMREIYEGKNKIFKIFASLCFPKIAYELYQLKKI